MISKSLITLLCVLSVFLPGCAGILDPGPPVSNIIFPVRMPSPSSGERLPAHILVSRPVADSATSTDRIMALMNGFEVKALDSSRLVYSIPLMIQRQLVDAMESTRRFEAVGWEESSLDENIRLITDIRRFFLRYDAPDKAPMVDVLLVFTLIRPDTGAVVARRLTREEEQCQGNSLKDFVTAFSLAMTRVLAETSQWVIEEVEAQQTQGTKQ